MRALISCTMAVLFGCVLFAAMQGEVNAAEPAPDYAATYHKIRRHLSDRFIDGNIDLSQFEHKYDGKIDSAESLQAAVKDMLSAVGDARLRILSYRESERYVARKAGGRVGVGLSVEERHFVTDTVTIKAVLGDSPAEDAALQAGDEIVAVNGTKLANIAYRQVTELLKGPAGSIVKLTVKRAGTELEIPVKRDIDGTLGVEISLENPTRLFKITTVYHGSPAEIAGLKTDDLIVAVDGDLATTMTEEQIYAKLRGNFGTATRLKVRRDNDTSDITIIRGIVPNWSLFIGLRSQNYLQFSSARTRGMTQIDLLSLDWPDVADLIDDYITGMNEHDACILDLRSCQGDPETAARVAARFIDQGEVLRYICREGNKTVEVAYRVDNRVLWRSTGIGTSTGVTSRQDKIEELPHLYENRLVVVINGRTRGAAESLAIALQRDGATLVGSGTAGDFVVCDTESFGEGDAKLFLQIPACTLKGVAGSRLSSVDPDRRVIVADPLTEAKKEVAGVYWYNDVEFILYGVMGIIALVVLFLFYRGARRAQTEQLKAAQATKDQGMASGSNVSTPTAAEPGAAADGAEAGTEPDPAVEGGNIKPVHVAPSPDTLVSDNQIASPKSDLRLRLLGYLIGFAIVALMLGLLIFIGYNKNSAPSGARSQVIVEFYTDGSEKSAQQAEVVEQLKREYDGPIEFRTFDVRQHPNFAPTYDGEQIEKVDRVPMIRVRYQWVGKDGKRISSGASWGGARTKRDLVEDIERAETNLNYQYRITEKIVRHKGRR